MEAVVNQKCDILIHLTAMKTNASNLLRKQALFNW